MDINSKLRNLRKILRDSSKNIISHVIKNHMARENDKAVNPGVNKCMFCGSMRSLSKEHVVPRWTIEKSTTRKFVNDVNGMSQNYNTTTIPACTNCNNNLLGNLEKYIRQLFKNTNLNEVYFSNEEKENIIRWLEVIDYKFEIFNIIKRFRASKNAGYIPYLADFSLSELRIPGPESPSKVISEIRRSQKRLTIKNKKHNLNSLIVFKTKNKGFHFFHQMDEFIFIELPQYGIALFYFYKKTFENEKDGYTASREIIDKIY